MKSKTLDFSSSKNNRSKGPFPQSPLQNNNIEPKFNENKNINEEDNCILF